MKYLVAIDSFKGSMTSIDAGLSAKKGILLADKNAEVIIKPIADGGEGTVCALVDGLGGKYKTVTVQGPLGKKVDADYGIVDNTAIIEMSASSGIALVKKDELNPLVATTFGLGELILDALDNGIRSFIIGIGGSATNDGGVGMLTALGYKFLDKNNLPIPFGGIYLKDICKIDTSCADLRLKECTFKIACDVKNPLLGENGCSFIFAPQKGCKKEDISRLDEAMANYAFITKKYIKTANENLQGAGAAGGLGFAFSSYLDGELVSGIKLILDLVNIEEEIKKADIVITGEGKIDAQTVMGKAPIGITKLAKKYGKMVLAFAGAVSNDARECNLAGMDGIFSITPSACTLEEAMNVNNAKSNMTFMVEQVIRIINK